MKSAGWFWSGACLVLLAQGAAAGELRSGSSAVDLVASFPAGSLVESSRCGAQLDLQFCVEPGAAAGPRLVLRLGLPDAAPQAAMSRLARVAGKFAGTTDIAVLGRFHIRLDLGLR